MIDCLNCKPLRDVRLGNGCGGGRSKTTCSPYHDPWLKSRNELNEVELRSQNENDDNDEYEESNDFKDANDTWQTRAMAQPLVMIVSKSKRPHVRNTNRSRTIQVNRNCRN